MALLILYDLHIRCKDQQHQTCLCIYHHNAIEGEEVATTSNIIVSENERRCTSKTNRQCYVDPDFNCNFNFAVFSEQMVTVIVLTFKVYKINNKRRIQCCLQ